MNTSGKKFKLERTHVRCYGRWSGLQTAALLLLLLPAVTRAQWQPRTLGTGNSTDWLLTMNPDGTLRWPSNFMALNGGGGSGTLVAGTGITITTIGSTNVISLYTAPTISLTAVGDGVAGTKEYGVTVAGTALTWTLGGATVTTQWVGNAALGQSQSIPVGTTSHTFIGAYTNSQTWTLYVSDGVTPKTTTATVPFSFKRYFGDSATANLTALLTLDGSEFASTRAKTYTDSAAGAYLYYAYPVAWGEATILFGGFADTSWACTTNAAFSNAAGYVSPYRIYRTGTAGTWSNITYTFQ